VLIGTDLKGSRNPPRALGRLRGPTSRRSLHIDLARVAFMIGVVGNGNQRELNRSLRVGHDPDGVPAWRRIMPRRRSDRRH
jgi:hypothetical protein